MNIITVQLSDLDHCDFEEGAGRVSLSQEWVTQNACLDVKENSWLVIKHKGVELFNGAIVDWQVGSGFCMSAESADLGGEG